MIKLIKWIKEYLPISRKEHNKSLRKITTVLKAITQADEQHSQLEMSLVQNMNALQAKKPGEKTIVPKDDPAYK